MGIPQILNNSDIPTLLCYYESGDEEQKNYCKKLIKYLNANGQINTEIKESNNFSIIFSYNFITHMIKTDSNLSDESIFAIIRTINNIYTLPYGNSLYQPQYNYNYLQNFNNNKHLRAINLFQPTKQKNLEDLKKKILDDEMNKRKKLSSQNIEKDEKINKELENMCNIGKIIKREIKEEKRKNPNNYIEVKDAIKLENQDKELFALALMGSILNENGTEVIIENNNNSEDDKLGENITFLQFISNGFIQKKKYDLHFDFGHGKNEELLNNKNEYEKFKNDLLEKLSLDYKIPKNQIIVTFPQRGSFRVQVIFQSDEFNNLDINEFKQKFQNDINFPQLNHLKEIHKTGIMEGCKLSKKQLDSRGNRFDGWPDNENRGKKPYYSPKGWIGIGLRVMDKYDNGNNNWIGMKNLDDEWCVAYHGVARNKDSKEVQKITGLIVNSTFKAGQNQVHEKHQDIYHPGSLVGNGVYITPKVEIAQQYSGYTVINNKKYQTVLMVRVKPESIRGCSDQIDYWVVNGTPDEIRPYRILYKEC